MTRLRLPPIPLPVEPPGVVRTRARGRIRLIGAAIMLVLAALGARGVQLCVTPSDRTAREAAIKRWAAVKVQARRGEILDRKGRRLATSVSTPNVIANPKMLRGSDIDSLAAQLSEILGRPTEVLARSLGREHSQYALLARRVHPAVALQVDRLTADAGLSPNALYSEPASQRYYPEETLAAQVLGFVDASGQGKAGLERSLEPHLAGGEIRVHQRVDGRRLAVGPSNDQGTLERAAGHTVHTTLDRQIQRITERALEGVLIRSEPSWASAVVMDVSSGDILALASAPTFNPNVPGDDPVPRRNHVMQDAIEPGSVFKPFTVALAVEAGLVGGSTMIDCEGGTWYVGRSRIRDDHPHGVVTVSDVVKYSSNIGAAKLALQLGNERFLDGLADFGFGERTGLDLPDERSGAVRSADKIRPIELATTSYGQGVTSTLMQLVSATATIANGGVRMRPRLVTRVEDSHGVPELIQPPVSVGRVISAETAAAVTEMMVTVTEPGGTATRAQVPGHRVAGKTGTAEKVENGRYGSGRIGSFIGFVPADDPVLAIVVSVDEPSKGSRYGGVVAAPPFAEIAAASLSHLGIEPTVVPPETVAEPLTAALPPTASAQPGPLDLVWSGDAWRVPDLVGRGLRELVAGLGSTGLSLTTSGSGFVVSQNPPAGTSLPPGKVVHVVLR